LLRREAFVALLTALGIDTAWFDSGVWKGSNQFDGLLEQDEERSLETQPIRAVDLS
jgi:hypothetical protein